MARNRELSESDLSYCTKAMVKYILNHAVKKQYMKTSEITKHCLKSESRFFDLVFEEAKAMLSDVSINGQYSRRPVIHQKMPNE